MCAFFINILPPIRRRSRYINISFIIILILIIGLLFQRMTEAIWNTHLQIFLLAPLNICINRKRKLSNHQKRNNNNLYFQHKYNFLILFAIICWFPYVILSIRLPITRFIWVTLNFIQICSEISRTLTFENIWFEVLF